VRVKEAQAQMSKKIRVKIVGAGGYGGIGLYELLRAHPQVELAALIDVENVGQTLGEVSPHLAGFATTPIVAPDSAAAQVPADVVFFATPDGVGQRGAAAELAAGRKVIDFSGDFRFRTPAEYAEYAGRIGREPKHAAPELLARGVYGLAELHREELARATLVGNPGCFAVSCILGLAPAVAAKLVDLATLICDSKTGISGAGKKPRPAFHYPEAYENAYAYRLSGHQHVVEIERELSRLAGREVRVTMTTQVIPLTRGIISTLYGQLTESDPRRVEEAYRDFYAGSRFVRVLSAKTQTGTAEVRGSNFCNLVVSTDERTGRLRVVSVIDNLVKGQAGSAVQNLNLVSGLDETAGLWQPGQRP
jgi:N-acetyl-gamma-glutamyl-phosphate reductase